MERILVAMDPGRTNFCGAIHALNLAKRIQAKVLFLLIFPNPGSGVKKHPQEELEISIKKRLESLIEEGRSDGIAVDYYLVNGDYERELVSFVQDNEITLLVVELPARKGSLSETYRKFLDKIRHRMNCRIEVVYEKPDKSKKKG